MIRSVDLEKLRVFYVVSKNMSFSEAAKELNLAQSTVSHHIAKLEKDLKLCLFERKTRSFELTVDGEKLLELTTPIFSALSHLENYLTIKDTEISGLLYIYGGENSLLSLLLDSIETFKATHPQLDFDIVGVNYFPVFSPAKLSVGILAKTDNQPDLTQKYLMSFHIGLYASKAYISRFGEPKTLDDLQNHRLIIFENHDLPFSSPNNWLLKEGMPEGKARKPYLIINTVPLTYCAAERGLGIITSPRESYFIQQNELIEILPHIPKPKLPAYFSYHKLHENHPSIRAFEKHLKDTVTAKGWS